MMAYINAQTKEKLEKAEYQKLMDVSLHMLN